SAGWDTLLGRFDSAWQGGGRPRLEDFVASEAGAGPIPALMALIHVDLEYRLKAREAARVEGYLSRFPHVGGDESRLLDVGAGESRRRRRSEPELSVEESARRFPPLGPALPGRLPVRSTQAGLPNGTPDPPALPGYEVLGSWAGARWASSTR